MNKTLRTILSIVLFIAAFIAIQTLVQAIGVAIYCQLKDLQYLQVVTAMAAGMYSKLLVITNIISSVITIALFALLRWSPPSRVYLRSKPWTVIVWTILLALGTILPAEWLYERMQIELPEQMEALFEGVMREPMGYLAVGILAPVAEEMVFRGAILRQLLTLFSRRFHWVAIVVSALIFGAIHLNMAQGIHAFVIGLLLGWLYYRTGSIVPGIVLHWVNNTVAFVMFNVMPELSDGKLIDLFHGNSRMMVYALMFSLCILLPSLFQLAMRTRK